MILLIWFGILSDDPLDEERLARQIVMVEPPISDCGNEPPSEVSAYQSAIGGRPDPLQAP
jgi:hypothetical protein